MLVVVYLAFAGGLMVFACRAPEGYEDEWGFHFGKPQNECSETTALTAVGKQCASERRVATIKERSATAGRDDGGERAQGMERYDLQAGELAPDLAPADRSVRVSKMVLGAMLMLVLVLQLAVILKACVDFGSPF